MNLDKKQIAWADNKIVKDQAKRVQKMLYCMYAVIGVVLMGMFVTGDVTAEEVFKIGGGTGTVMTIMGGVGSIDLDPNTKRVGKQIKNKVYILSEDQVDTTANFPGRNVDLEISTIPLKNGEYWHYIGTVHDTPELKSAGSEGEIAANITNELNLVLGGAGKKVRKLLEDGLNSGFYIVLEICATGDKYLLGTGCKPAIMKSFEGGSTKDNTSFNVVFKQESVVTWSYYTGTLQMLAASVVAPDATEIPLVSNPSYQLSSGTAGPATITTFSGVTDDDIGRIVTVLGSGGTHPSLIAAAADFLLEGGAQWEAAEGTSISFKIYKDGGATYKFIEVNGSRQ